MLATNLDAEMIRTGGHTIYRANTADSRLPTVAGNAVFDQLGGRWLMRYIRPYSLADYDPNSPRSHFDGPAYVTPTPYSTDDVISWLALPPHLPAPNYAVLIDPRAVDALGPRWVRLGNGIEYVLPNGYDLHDVVYPRWPILVR